MKGLIICLVPLCLFSCKKEKSAQRQEIKGILLHNITGQPLSGQRIDLYTFEYWFDESRMNNEFPYGYPVTRTIKLSGTTNSEGKYFFQFTPEYEWRYALHVNTPEYTLKIRNSWQLTANQTPYPLYTSNSYNDTLYAEKPGYILYNVINIPPAFANDSLLVFPEGGFTSHALTSSISAVTSIYKVRKGIESFYGANVNAQIIDTIPCESDVRHPVKWQYSRNGNISHNIDSVTVSPFNTTVYSVNY